MFLNFCFVKLRRVFCSLKHLIGGYPNSVLGMSFDDGLDFVINIVKGIALDDPGEIINEVMFKPEGPVKGLVGLLLRHAVIDGHDERGVAGLQEYGNWIESCRLQPFNSISTDL